MIKVGCNGAGAPADLKHAVSPAEPDDVSSSPWSALPRHGWRDRQVDGGPLLMLGVLPS